MCVWGNIINLRKMSAPTAFVNRKDGRPVIKKQTTMFYNQGSVIDYVIFDEFENIVNKVYIDKNGYFNQCSTFLTHCITALVCHIKLPLQAHNLCSCRHLERHQDYLNYQCFQSQSTRNHILLSSLLTPLFMFRGKTQTNEQTQNKQVLFVCQATFL